MKLTCSCGAPAVAFRPGTAPETFDLLGTVFVTNAGEPDAQWCDKCWRKAFATRGSAFSEPTRQAGEVARHFQTKVAE